MIKSWRIGDHRKESGLSFKRFSDCKIGYSFADNEHAAKWQFATQLYAVYGLSPEELRYLVLKNNKQNFGLLIRNWIQR